jgi:hypothetical protein
VGRFLRRFLLDHDPLAFVTLVQEALDVTLQVPGAGIRHPTTRTQEGHRTQIEFACVHKSESVKVGVVGEIREVPKQGSGNATAQEHIVVTAPLPGVLG